MVLFSVSFSRLSITAVPCKVFLRSFSASCTKMANAQGGASGRRVYVLGVGMTKFEKPGSRANFDYPDMARESVTAALRDSRLQYKDVQQAFCGYVYGDSTCGQRALYEVGLTGIPISNVNNNCSTGSTAILLATQAIRAGLDCVLAVGFEKMEKGSLQTHFNDRTNPLEKHVLVLADKYGVQNGPIAPQLFGAAAKEYSEKYGVDITAELEWIAYKNHKHSVQNSRSQFRDEYTVEQIRASPKVAHLLTKLQCCPTSDGSAAAVLVSDSYLDKLVNSGTDAEREYLREKAVELLDIQMATDLPSSFEERSCIKMVGYDMAKTAADRVYASTGLKPSDFPVIELHDCFSANEFITYEALGLAAPGTAKQLVAARDVTYGGKHVVNPSGGLISKGHPLGATGLAQCAELCWQLRGEAGKRQVTTNGVLPRYALQHNIGLGGAAVVAAYRAPAIQRVKSEAGANAEPSAQPVSAVQPPKASGDAFKTLSLFEAIRQMVPNNPELAQKWTGAVGFRVRNSAGEELRVLVRSVGTGASKTVEVAIDAPASTLSETEKQKGSCVIDIGDDDLTKAFTGEAKGQQLYFSGKMKIKGDIMAAMQLQKLQVAQPKL